jgi:hypothetical protein
VDENLILNNQTNGIRQMGSEYSIVGLVVLGG